MNASTINKHCEHMMNLKKNSLSYANLWSHYIIRFLCPVRLGKRLNSAPTQYVLLPAKMWFIVNKKETAELSFRFITCEFLVQ